MIGSVIGSSSMLQIQLEAFEVVLLPQKAAYIAQYGLLLVSDIHLGKSETFQAMGIPIANRVNQVNIERLQSLCDRWQPKQLIILGDLFHSSFAWVPEVLEAWLAFLHQSNVSVRLLLGNHDRALLTRLQTLPMECLTTAIEQDKLVLSHEPVAIPGCFNICGHIHPCLRLKTRLDSLRLPCFHYEPEQLTLPSFGEFTGGYEITLKPGAIAYVIADNAVIPFEG